MDEINELTISVTNKEGDDGLSIKVTGSPNTVLGFISRAKFELEYIEKDVFDTITRNEKEEN